jgi:hypothetical protein
MINKMNNYNLTPEQSKVIDTIYNLIWHRITQDDKFIEAIPEIDTPDFHEWIYYIKYELIEYDDSLIQAVIYLNGKHYEYSETPQIGNGQIWVNEIEESKVKTKIIELGGQIDDTFEIYTTDLTVDSKIRNKNSDNEYFDLPF